MSSSPSSDDCSLSDSPPPTLFSIKQETCSGSTHRKRSRATQRQAETPAGSEEEDVDPNETEHDRAKRRRKEQRMQRNRLSAARSRKRKEDALETLSKENASLRDELALLKSQLAAATSQGFAASCHVPNLHCDFCGHTSPRDDPAAPGCGVSDPVVSSLPSIPVVVFAASCDAAAVASPETEKMDSVHSSPYGAGFCYGSDAVCAPRDSCPLIATSSYGSDSNRHTDNSQHLTFSPALAPVFDDADPANNKVPVWNACPAPPAAPPAPAFDTDDAIINAIVSEDFDFAMDCYDAHPDDMLEGLL